MDLAGFVLAATTADLADEPRARPHADAVEFRMDLADEPLAALRDYEGDLPVVATNRAAWEGGGAGADGARLDALAAAAEVESVAAVDVELRSLTGGEHATDEHATGAERVVDAARDAGAAVVVSVHDFEGTPPLAEMTDLLAAASDVGDVGKLAVTAGDADDALALLRTTREATASGDAVATMAMGEPGRHTRAVAPVYGSRIGYAPVDPVRATAPGQFDLATLRSLVDALGGST